MHMDRERTDCAFDRLGELVACIVLLVVGGALVGLATLA